MKHDWQMRQFHCDDTFEGERTCTQTWQCPRCEQTIKLPSGITPRVESACIDTREERYQAQVRLEKIKERFPTGWGNGNKARRVKK